MASMTWYEYILSSFSDFITYHSFPEHSTPATQASLLVQIQSSMLPLRACALTILLSKQSSTCYLQPLLDLSKSLFKYHHIKRPKVTLLPCLAFFVFMVHIALPISTHIYLLLLISCMSHPHLSHLTAITFHYFYLFCCSYFTALFYPLHLEQSGI